MTPREREILRDQIADQLVEMEPWFKGPYKLSFIARAPHLADGDVLVTSDDPALIIAAVQRLASYPPVTAGATSLAQGAPASAPDSSRDFSLGGGAESS